AGADADDSALADATVNIVSNTIEQSCSVITNFDRYLIIDIFLLRLEIHFGKRPPGKLHSAAERPGFCVLPRNRATTKPRSTPAARSRTRIQTVRIHRP